jgi:hypothetical protein
MTEITSLQNLWLITKLKYRGYGSYGNSIISNLVINKYFSIIIKNPVYTFLCTHIIYKTRFCIICATDPHAYGDLCMGNYAMGIQDLISHMEIFPVCIQLVTEISPYAYWDRTNPRMHTGITCHAIPISPYAYGDLCDLHMHTGIDLNPRMHTGIA